MTAAALLREAADLATDLLTDLPDRLAHTLAAGAAAARLALALPPRDRDTLVLAATLHDIGYAPALARTGFHPLDGARHLAESGFPERVCGLVAHHSGARFAAVRRGLTAQLRVFPLEAGAVHDALLYADLTTSPQGQPVTFEQRITEILTRYPPGHLVHATMTAARPYLADRVQRTETRLTIDNRRARGTACGRG